MNPNQLNVQNNGGSAQVAQPGNKGDEEDVAMDEDDIAFNEIPIINYKSNNIKKKEHFMQPAAMMSPGGRLAMEAPMSPGAGFCMRDNQFKQAANSSYFKSIGGQGGVMDQLSPRSDGGGANHCICGLPMRPGQETCDQCEGKNSIYIEGMIIKK